VRLQAVRVHRQLAQLKTMFQRIEPRMAADNAPVAQAMRALAQKLDAIDHEVPRCTSGRGCCSTRWRRE
jgi:zinc transporter